MDRLKKKKKELERYFGAKSRAFCVFYLFVCLFFLACPQHMEVPQPGMEPVSQQ